MSFFLGPSGWAKNGVVHFVGWCVSTLGGFPLGGTKQLCALQGTILVVTTLCPWIRFHGHYRWHYNNLMSTTSTKDDAVVLPFTTYMILSSWCFEWCFE
jgi:hypothetical protein